MRKKADRGRAATGGSKLQRLRQENVDLREVARTASVRLAAADFICRPVLLGQVSEFHAGLASQIVQAIHDHSGACALAQVLEAAWHHYEACQANNGLVEAEQRLWGALLRLPEYLRPALDTVGATELIEQEVSLV
jgi:hypothetical protein